MASSDQKAKIAEIVQEDASYDNDHYMPLDWRSSAMRDLRKGNIDGMKKKSAPLAQFKLLEVMNTSYDNKEVLKSVEMVLGQTGHGAVQKVEHSIPYDRLPADQLVSVISSKLDRIMKLNPNFDITKILPAKKESVLDAELVPDDRVPLDEEATLDE